LITAATYALYLVSQRNTELDKFLVLTIQFFTAVILLPFYPSHSGLLPVEPLFMAVY
jgi:chloramphenicol-sensitive protein RarD